MRFSCDCLCEFLPQSATRVVLSKTSESKQDKIHDILARYAVVSSELHNIKSIYGAYFRESSSFLRWIHIFLKGLGQELLFQQ